MPSICQQQQEDRAVARKMSDTVVSSRSRRFMALQHVERLSLTGSCIPRPLFQQPGVPRRQPHRDSGLAVATLPSVGAIP